MRQAQSQTNISNVLQPSQTNASLNQSHRGSTSSFINALKGSENNKEKDKRYSDKVKQLKSENKKLVNLLRDSERLFY